MSSEPSAFSQLQHEVLPDLTKSLGQTLLHAGTAQGANLREMINYHLETGGKRLRPLAVFLTAKVYGESRGETWDWQKEKARLLPFAIAVELLHNATLVHDDLQDGDTLRRGQATLWKKYSPEQAINCGDYLFFAALAALHGDFYTAKESVALQNLLIHSAIRVIEGQGREFELKAILHQQMRWPSLAEYKAMAEGKTSALFSLPVLGAAILVGATEEERHRLENCVRTLGYLFQICDDWIDLWGAKGRDCTGSDIAEGKLSYPIVMALERTKTSDAELNLRILEIVRKPRTDTSLAEIQWVLNVFQELGLRNSLAREIHGAVQATKCEMGGSPFGASIGLLLDSFTKEVSFSDESGSPS